MGGRFSPERSDLVMPGPGAFRAMMKRVGRLDTNAVVAASAEISERIPAVTGRRVLAISDRGTIVFSGSRELAEKRLRSRAAVLSGRWQALEEVPRPTHILFEPGTAAALYCAEEVYTLPGFQLCSFDSTPLIEGSELKEAPPATDGPVAVSLEKMLFDQQALLRAECTPPLDEEARFLHWPRPGPWSARFADSLCTIRSRLGSAQALFKPRTLRLTPFLGHAVEELSLSVVGSRNGSQQWRADKTTRVHSGEELRFELPADAVDTVRINVVPNFLPFLKLKDLSLTIEPSAEPVP
jgi:hypothetical protein